MKNKRKNIQNRITVIGIFFASFIAYLASDLPRLIQQPLVGDLLTIYALVGTVYTAYYLIVAMFQLGDFNNADYLPHLFTDEYENLIYPVVARYIAMSIFGLIPYLLQWRMGAYVFVIILPLILSSVIFNRNKIRRFFSRKNDKR